MRAVQTINHFETIFWLPKVLDKCFLLLNNGNNTVLTVLILCWWCSPDMVCTAQETTVALHQKQSITFHPLFCVFAQVFTFKLHFSLVFFVHNNAY